ncbi:MAG: hypothetical protein SNJ77_03930 [Cytophagales bacterium]
MKKLFILSLVLLSSAAYCQKGYEFYQMSTVESVVPGGLGRSRLIATDDKGQIQEKNLENFFSMVGINFGNIRNNDRVITDKIQELAEQGWELFQTTTGVYGTEKSTGIFITRYLFRREKQK